MAMALAFFLNGLVLARALEVTTNVSVDTTWSLSDSPVNIQTYTFRVEEGATLTIDPGVMVRVWGAIYVEGRLRALGTDDQRIVFQALYPGGWGPLQFRRVTSVELVTNTLSFVDLTQLNSYLYVSEKTLRMNDCTVDASGNLPYGLAAYVNSSAGHPYAGATIILSNNVFSIFTERNSGSGSFYGLLFDGFESDLLDNQISVTATGSIMAVYGVRLYVSNTRPFQGRLAGNQIDVMTSNGGIPNSYGVSYDAQAFGPVEGNEITVSGYGGICGLEKVDLGPVEGNMLSMISTSGASFGYVVGIQSLLTSEGTNDALVNNRIHLFSDQGSRYLTGIECQSGRTRGNRIRGTHIGESGSLCGIRQIYYDGSLEANTVLLEPSNGVPAAAFDMSSHYNPSHVVIVENNLLACNGTGPSVGLFVDSSFGAILSNRFNVAHGFEVPWSNCVAGVGSGTNDPLLDPETLRLMAGSPCVDRGTNATWMNAALDTDGKPRIDNACVDIGADEYFYPPVGLGLAQAEDGLAFTWSVLSNAVCRVEGTSQMAPDDWRPLSHSLTSTATTLIWVDTNAPGETLFYRAARLWGADGAGP